MEALFVHVLKSTALTVLFLGCYLVFLRKETFFNSNRIYLLGGIIISLLLPFLKFTKVVWVERQPIDYGAYNVVESAAPLVEEGFNWFGLITSVYFIGIAFFSIRLLVQLWSIKQIKKKSIVFKEDDIKHVHSEKQLSPFSFFKNIFYCPTQFEETELEAILTHEKAHARQHHSIDVLLMQIVCILLWFNPLVWLYNHYIKQNLEFQADALALKGISDKKQYQYVMLKQAVGHGNLRIASAFFNSLTKKRITMLHQKQSKQINSLKLVLVLPFLVVFLLSFNTNEVVKFNESKVPKTVLEDLPPDFVSPLRQTDIKKVSSDFGPTRNPFTKQMQFHNGIDLVASLGKPVMASASGIVSTSSIDSERGNYIVIEHADGYSTKYMHLENRSVDKGDKIATGTTIGYVGNTGKSKGPHLHFEILESGKPVNPASFVPFKVTEEVNAVKAVNKPAAAKSVKSIELMINKNTTNEELEKMKSDLAKDNIDFSYTTVRNENREIIDIAINVSGGGDNGRKFSNSHSSSDNENGISPVIIKIDPKNNSASIMTKGDYKSNMKKIKTSANATWISADDDNQEIIIKQEDGVHKIIIDGEEVDVDDIDDDSVEIHLDKNGKGKTKYKRIKVERSNTSDGDSNVFIIKDSDEESDMEVISEDDSFFFIDTDGEKDPFYVIDGKEAKKKDVKKIAPDSIESINVLKGEAAKKKYGKKAKNGVIEITTKN
ncbi:M23/M56 family metallopeptidase [Croceivirga thetidis]|uniref:Peptidoglycan DD-metalloendopeptidase family protein n=1 Tax=Croceivirga thetidis TaxID=2721623 RepID=A0ABX1GSW4_9FLAO|nr:M23/M56 family metallopeptidase [Croceivirga thetidis]NKI33047.1 peptidoglycan DD-metalloendopeptidase family protein [Croceivirga thetidis]